METTALLPGVEAGATVLFVHAHPDDETLVTGATMAAAAAAGAHVVLVTCTRGELGEVIPPELAHLEVKAEGPCRGSGRGSDRRGWIGRRAGSGT
ncbi:PIG-L family deacetylase [Arthrobacter psychrolactophilus]